jgi:competence protein ComEC
MSNIKYIIKENIIFILLIIVTILRMVYVMNKHYSSDLDMKLGSEVSLRGTIVSESIAKKNSQTFILEINSETNIKVTTEPYQEYFYGDKIEVSGKLSMPRNFMGDTGREFDYINYLRKDDIYYEIKKANVTILNNDTQFDLGTKLNKLKKAFVNNLNKVLGEPHSALASGLVVGEKASLGKDIIDNFRKAGLIHIVVLSGYNITIIATTIRRLLSFLPRNISIVLGMIGIILFGILVGGGATVIRSCIMAIIALIGELFRKDYKVLRALFIAGLLMLIQNPLILFYDPSFQLSFLASFGLIVLASPIEKRLTFITDRYGIRGVIASTIATQIFVSPYILYMMGQISIVGMFVNIIVLPFIPLTMLLVCLSGLFGFVSIIISKLFAYGAHILLSYELFIVEKSANLPFSSIVVPPFSPYIVLFIYITYFIIFFKFSSIFTQFKFEKKSSI